MTEDLRSGTPARMVGRKWGCCHKLVRVIAERNGYSPPAFVPHSCDESAFDTLTPDAEYAIGLLITDGNINDSREDRQDAVYLSLNNEGMVQVEWLKRFLKATHPVCYYDASRKNGTPTRRAVLSVNSNRLSAALAGYGVTPRKTPTARLLRGVERSRHAWRGCIDGDGSVKQAKGTGYPTVDMNGSRSLVGQFREFVTEHVGPGRGVVLPTESDCFRFSVHGDRACAVLRLLYGNCTAAMPAKRDRAWKAIRDWQGDAGLDPRLMPGAALDGVPPVLPRRDQAWKRRKHGVPDRPDITLEELLNDRDRLGGWRSVADHHGVTYETIRQIRRTLRTRAAREAARTDR